MGKLLQISIIIAMIAIPVRAAHERNVERGLRKAIKNMLIYNLVYLFILLFLFGRV